MSAKSRVTGVRPSIVQVLDYTAGFYIGLMLASGGLWVVGTVAMFLRSWGLPV